MEHVKYFEVPYENAENALKKLGMSEDVARSNVQFQRCINEHIAISDAVRTAQNTTRTPIEEFAGSWAAALRSS